jgi:hypothetical protein
VKASIARVTSLIRAELSPDLSSQEAAWAVRQKYQRWLRGLALAFVPFGSIASVLFLKEFPSAEIGFLAWGCAHLGCVLYVTFRLNTLPCPVCHRDFARFRMDPFAQVCSSCGARVPPQRRRRRSKPIAQGAEPPRVDPDQRSGDLSPRPRKKFF